jgi:hypothetical protein
MSSRSESLGHGKATRCAVCDGKFGLVRYHSWRPPFVQRSAWIALKLVGKATAIGWVGSNLPLTHC